MWGTAKIEYQTGRQLINSPGTLCGFDLMAMTIEKLFLIIIESFFT